MFDAIWDMKIGYVLCGIIWSLACGFAVGNYACSLVHRLPRGRLILDKTPYCGNCGTLLQTADLFPVFSALWLRHRCRYCKQPYPVSHTWTELLVGLLFVLAFFQHGYGEYFMLIAFIGVFLITLAAIEANDRIIMGKILLCLVVCGMIYRTLADGSIYGFVQSGLTGLLAGAFLWRKAIQKVGHVYMLPPQAQMIAVGAICVGQAQLLLFAVLMLGFTALFFLLAVLRHKPLALSVPFGFAVILPVLYPKLSLLALIPHPGK
ncbi:MAG: prepilin peptidase [Alphaproteobacteria bacterium]|nr:prepilin peptidase [Alphaproteobacteria bacterium]